MRRSEASASSGKTLAPPIVRSSSPLAASSESRIASASSRRTPRRQYHLLSGSIAASDGSLAAAARRYVLDVTISRCSRLAASAALEQLAGEPIQQLAMRRPGSARAEVVAGGDQPWAEMMLPDAVDPTRAHQRVVAAGEPVGQRSTRLLVIDSRRQTKDRRPGGRSFGDAAVHVAPLDTQALAAESDFVS